MPLCHFFLFSLQNATKFRFFDDKKLNNTQLLLKSERGPARIGSVHCQQSDTGSTKTAANPAICPDTTLLSSFYPIRQAKRR